MCQKSMPVLVSVSNFSCMLHMCVHVEQLYVLVSSVLRGVLSCLRTLLLQSTQKLNQFVWIRVSDKPPGIPPLPSTSNAQHTREPPP